MHYAMYKQLNLNVKRLQFTGFIKLDCLTLKMEALSFSETSATNYKSTRRNIPEDMRNQINENYSPGRNVHGK
jgi:hypothetical protein